MKFWTSYKPHCSKCGPCSSTISYKSTTLTAESSCSPSQYSSSVSSIDNKEDYPKALKDLREPLDYIDTLLKNVNLPVLVSGIYPRKARPTSLKETLLPTQLFHLYHYPIPTRHTTLEEGTNNEEPLENDMLKENLLGSLAVVFQWLFIIGSFLKIWLNYR